MSARVAIVTGGSSGIGRASALALARDGFDVGITYRANEAGAARVRAEVERIGRAAHALQADQSTPSAAGEAVRQLSELLGGVDVLVNNAGANRRMDILEETEAEWRRTLDVNLTGPFLAAQAAARAMVEQGRGGRIVNVTSILETTPLIGAGAYCASKAALGMLTKVMAIDLAPHGITVTAVAPGHTATPMNDFADDADVTAAPRPAIPLGRPATADEIAAFIAFLCSPAASYATGASFLVDGGLALVTGPQVLERSIEDGD